MKVHPNSQKIAVKPKRLNLIIAQIDATKGENAGNEEGDVNMNRRFAFSIISKTAAKNGTKAIL